MHNGKRGRTRTDNACTRRCIDGARVVSSRTRTEGRAAGQLPTFPYEWRVIQEPVIQEPRPLAYTVI